MAVGRLGVPVSTRRVAGVGLVVICYRLLFSVGKSHSPILSGGASGKTSASVISRSGVVA